MNEMTIYTSMQTFLQQEMLRGKERSAAIEDAGKTIKGLIDKSTELAKYAAEKSIENQGGK